MQINDLQNISSTVLPPFSHLNISSRCFHLLICLSRHSHLCLCVTPTACLLFPAPPLHLYTCMCLHLSIELYRERERFTHHPQPTINECMVWMHTFSNTLFLRYLLHSYIFWLVIWLPAPRNAFSSTQM